MPPLPPITQALILVNVAIFCLQTIIPGLDALLALWPAGTPRFEPWQIVTYAFVHGGWTHLLFNMIGIWMFGGDVEQNWGARRYLQLYFASLLIAALTQLAIAPLFGSGAATIGASGAFFGLLVAFAMTDPNRRVMLLIPPIPVKARTLAIVYGLLEVYVLLPDYFPGVGVLTYLTGSVSHVAHLGGMLGGFLMVRYWRRQAPFKRTRRGA
jgi:membrane associated rhomboid family serine protease